MGWMAAALFTVASVALGEAAEAPTPTLPRLRAESPVMSAAIDLGTGRSPALRELRVRIDLTDGIVFVKEGVCGHGVRACLHLSVSIAGPYRALFIRVDPRKLKGCVLTGAIGHELQHAIEVLSDPGVRSGVAMLLLYQRLGPTSSGRFETEAAIQAGLDVERETCARSAPPA
jgi:hypothetical protein